jgi:hypothetical protein
MSTEAQIAANRINAQASTGARTAAGRSRVSRNAISSGLYSSRDFVRPDEQDLYAEFCAGFELNLVPEGAIEHTLAAEIIHSAWRLRRCSVVEAGMNCVTDGESDPMLDHPQQQPVDRARAQAHRLFHRATAELRRIQTERQFRNQFLDEEVELGLASYKEISKQPKPAITIQTQSTPERTGRNTPCTCGSGQKFKRCCGKGAPAILNNAA